MQANSYRMADYFQSHRLGGSEVADRPTFLITVRCQSAGSRTPLQRDVCCVKLFPTQQVTFSVDITTVVVTHCCHSIPLTLAVSATLLGRTEAASPDDWQAFKQHYGRAYPPEEEHFRRQVFADNLEIIRRHNVKFDVGRSTFRLGMNQFADLTNDEFRQHVLSSLAPVVPREPAVPRASPDMAASSPGKSAGRSIPDEFDWRQQGVPITIRDQGQMGAAWPIPVVSSVESGVFISNGRQVSLSRQNLVDCVSWPSMAGALEYVRDHGLASEADYPETGAAGPCRQVAPTAGLDQVHQVPEGDEVALAEGLLQNPVPLLIDAGQASFQFYTSGIYSDDGCSAARLDHALLLVGYGTSTGTDFWTLANSWGTAWGEQGFLRLERGVNMCGVASSAAYPTGVHLL